MMARGTRRSLNAYFTANSGSGGAILLRAADIKRRPVVDLDVAEKIGEIQEMILDPGTARVAGLAVSGGGGFIGTPKQLLIPSSSVHAIGPDAVMVRRPPASEEVPAYLSALPRVSDLAGRRLVSDAGRLVGSVCDVFFDSQDGRLIGYEFRPPNGSGGLDSLLGMGRSRSFNYVKAEANLRIGANIIVVPDDSVVHSSEVDADDGEIITGRWHDAAGDDGQTREFVVEEHQKAS
jgi:sporulation protein YlmC with PRC-barrel domain